MIIDRTRKAPKRPRRPARMVGAPIEEDLTVEETPIEEQGDPGDPEEVQGGGTGDTEDSSGAQKPPEPSPAPEKPTSKPRRTPPRKKVEDASA